MMKLNKLRLGSWAMCLMAGAGVTSAEPEKIAPKTLDFLSETVISGYVQSSYQHTWNSEGNPGNTPNRLFDSTKNSFNLDQAKITLEKPLSEADYAAGYRIDMLYGTTAEMIHSTEGANGSKKNFDLGNDGDLEQAYLQFRIPVGTGLDVKFGKFVTLLGNEVIDAPGNWNYSRSYMFGYGVPFTHTGALLSYTFLKADDKHPFGLDTQLAVVNGWDNVTDNNSGKSVMGRIGMTLLGGKLVFSTMGITGPEQDSNNDDYRTVLDEVVTWNATDKLSFAVEGLYGMERRSDIAVTRSDFDWWGAAVYGKYQWTKYFSTAARAEYFSDVGGSRFGTGQDAGISYLPANTSVDVAEFTLSAQVDNVWKNLTPRLEVRYDKANRGIFSEDGAQSVLTTSLDIIYAF